MSFRSRTPPAGRIHPGRLHPGLALLASAAILLLLESGCVRGGRPRVIAAELLDELHPDGVAQVGETIILTLDRPLPDGFSPEEVEVYSAPPRQRLLVEVLVPTGQPRRLDLVIRTTPPPLHPEGIFGGNPQAPDGPSGLGVILVPGSSGEEWVDLQERRRFPVLERAYWEDRPVPGEPGGNLTVDAGDWIRMEFDREVVIRGEEAVRVPADFILSNPQDQLDDGTVPTTLRAGEHGKEIILVLGSRPRLNVAVRDRPGPREGKKESDPEEGSSGAPSGIAINGTTIQPAARIVDRRGWPGAISRRSVEIGHSKQGHFFFERKPDAPFLAPGHRVDATLTPLPGGRALLAGGRTASQEAIGQVLLFDPSAPRPFQALGEMPERRYFHTATALPGKDRLPGTEDDVVIIAGGTDGKRTLETLCAVKPSPPGGAPVEIERLNVTLRVPRMQHTAVFIPPDLLLVEGGRYSPLAGVGGIISAVEIFSIESRGGKVLVRDHFDFPSLPRMRHASLYLGTGQDGAHYLFTHGGTGALPSFRAGDPGRALLNPDEAVVLASPVLLRVEALPAKPAAASPLPPAPPLTPAPDGGGGPAAEDDVTIGNKLRLRRIPLEFEYRYEMLRYDHLAAAVDFDPLSVKPGQAREVILAGGLLKPPNFDPDRPGRNLLEPPRRAEDWPGWKRPSLTESAAALILDFDPADPAKSALRVVDSPTGDRRVHLALVPLSPFPGVLLLGGENPYQSDEIFSTGEIYLPREKRLSPLAISLSAPRTRLGAYATTTGDGWTVHVLGGSTTPRELPGFTDLEQLRIEWPR